MRQITKIMFFLILGLCLSSFFLVNVVSAAGLIPDCGPQGACSFKDLFILLDNLLNFFVLELTIPIGVIAFLWTGFQIIRNAKKADALAEAKKTLWAIVLGLLIILGAFLIIKLIVLGVVGSGDPGGYHLQDIFKDKQVAPLGD